MSASNRNKQLFRCLAVSIAATSLALVAGCSSDPQRYEYIHTAGVELGYNMPYTPAIKVHSGKLVFLSGVTAAPIYHSHPHVPAEFDDLSFDAGSQATLTMANLKLAVEAAGGQLSDIVQLTRFMVDQDANQDAINAAIAVAWGSDHRPASTSIEIPRLATDPRLVLEIAAIAVVPE
ncbi:MAG: RidA family protein [Gammaproteobacteria bacterium]|nr:MAG: RidA family protein [Gammaproteobacteria bacterium]